ERVWVIKWEVGQHIGCRTTIIISQHGGLNLFSSLSTAQTDVEHSLTHYIAAGGAARHRRANWSQFEAVEPYALRTLIVDECTTSSLEDAETPQGTPERSFKLL